MFCFSNMTHASFKETSLDGVLNMPFFQIEKSDFQLLLDSILKQSEVYLKSVLYQILINTVSIRKTFSLIPSIWT